MQVSDRNKNTRSIAVLLCCLLVADYAYTTGFLWWGSHQFCADFLGSYCLGMVAKTGVVAAFIAGLS